MILAYMRDPTGAGDNFKIVLTSKVCFLCKAKVSSEEKDKGV